MKTKISFLNKRIIASLALLTAVMSNNLFSAELVFDLDGYLSGLDRLYAIYDMVNNGITTIENQYQQIQQAVERAKSIDWENIEFDGDIDVRDDIRNANKRINKLLNQTRQVKSTLTKQNLQVGNKRYSLADLCGVGQDGRSVFSAVDDAGEFITETYSKVCDDVAGKMTEEQRKAIWAKYGISPRNYVFVHESVKQVKEAAAWAMAKVTDEAQELQRTSRIEDTNAVLAGAFESLDSDGNMTAAAMQEAIMRLTANLCNDLITMNEALDEIANMVSEAKILEENRREAELEAKKQKEAQRDAIASKVSVDFKRNSFKTDSNSWIDIPVVEAFEYFLGVLAFMMSMACKYGTLFGLIGLAWSAFRLINSRLTVKDLFWNTIYKWVLYILMLNLYVPFTNGIVSIANQIGTKAGSGKETIIAELTEMKDALQDDLSKAEENSDGLKKELESTFTDFHLSTKLSDCDSYSEYVATVKQEISDTVYGQWNSNIDVRKANQIVDKYKKEDKYNLQNSAKIIAAVKDVLVEKNLDGTDGDKLTDTYIDLNIWLKNSNGNDSYYLSPAGLMRIALLGCTVMWTKMQMRFSSISENDKTVTILKDLRETFTNIPAMILTAIICLALIMSALFAVIQYSMTIIEYTIIVGIGAFYIPFILFDGTKDLPKKLIPVFFGFMIKMLVMTLCLYFVFYLFINNTVKIIGDTGGMNWTMAGSQLFTCLLCFILTQNAPKVAQTLLTGQPQLSMGEFMAAVGTAYGAGRAARAGKNAAAAGMNVARSGAQGAVNMAGGAAKMARSGAAAAGAVKNAGGSRFQQAASGVQGMYASFSGDVGEALARKGENFMHGGKGGAGGSSGSNGMAAHQQSGQTAKGEFLNKTSNPNFQNATRYDQKTGSQRNMTLGEFAEEKQRQGEMIGNNIGQKNAEIVQQKKEEKKPEKIEPLPDRLLS